MHRAKMINDKIFQQAMINLDKGYNCEAFKVFSQCLDNMLDLHELSEEKNEVMPTTVETTPKMVEYKVEDTHIDDNIRKMEKYFFDYVKSKKVYHNARTDSTKADCNKQLEYFLKAMTGVIMELVSSSDFQEERDTIKMKLRDIFNSI